MCIRDRHSWMMCACCLLFILTLVFTWAVVTRAFSHAALPAVLNVALTSPRAISSPGWKLRIPSDAAQRFDLHAQSVRVLLGTTLGLTGCNRSLISEVLCGAHVRVQGDRGRLYQWWRGFPNAYRRESSHRSSVQQYGIGEGEVLHTLLMGATEQGDSWFQLELANWNFFEYPMESVLHIFTYLEYKLNHRQIGPLGTSWFVDSNPLVLSWAHMQEHQGGAACVSG
eukprot:TRINITY_DN4820_c0_g1_i1.p1 TRINITY_DN4820_c0_g1~~TRINITY_DN4820_c0_g1_i1.p1  ORF type:complete len:226 (+),score=17.53 TRINITY_DN4820_c0_g1_i1:156-833(+)